MVGGVEYSSVGLFDHFVVWLEFALIFAVIIWFGAYRSGQTLAGLSD